MINEKVTSYIPDANEYAVQIDATEFKYFIRWTFVIGAVFGALMTCLLIALVYILKAI